MPEGSVEREVVQTEQSVAGSWRPENMRHIQLENSHGTRNPTTRVKNVRETFTEYFNGSGEVDWQREAIGTIGHNMVHSFFVLYVHCTYPCCSMYLFTFT